MRSLFRLYGWVNGGAVGALPWWTLASIPAVLVLQAALAYGLGSLELAVILGFAHVALLVWVGLVMHARAIGLAQDLRYELSLRANLFASGFVPRAMYLDGGAANASLMLLILKCLELQRPRAVLELGSGQTTRLLAHYRRETPGVEVVTLEEDPVWFATLRERLATEAGIHDYRCAPLREVEVPAGPGAPGRVRWFGGVDDLRRQAFDLIIVDGPKGEMRYSRAGILAYLPGVLAPSFVLIFDDAERFGERATIGMTHAILRRAGRPYVSFTVAGARRQVVFCSPDLAVLRTL